ncbi:MAG: SPOR domain-containing protein [Thiothrix sp.]|uniref:SPOR domain-containing protein n=1 Tax=Thiothrix sp. TaxID=1032 RepID=UPI00262F03C3|nr:SPOR domain-containing protein [Thiothrix sp.]MDD5394705.1 SPOR domain-containing protein [Thiothrix sp.]
MDNKATTKRMIGAVVLVLVAALLLAFLLKGKNREGQEMAMNQGAETKPILGFPGMGSADQKPMLVGEDPNAAQNAVTAAGQTVATTAGQAVDAAGNLIPNVATVPNTTGFDVRPAANGETRQVLDTDGKMKDGSGNLGTGDPKAAATATTSSAAAGTGLLGGGMDQADAGNGSASKADSASNKDRPVDTVVEKKPATRPVLVNERAVPSASAESKAKAEAAKKLAAEKAAKAKSEELAKATGTGAHVTSTASSAAAGGSYGIQLSASSDKAKAEAVAATFRAEGYKTSVVAAKVDGKTVYRAVIGGYADKAAAAAAQAKMKARFTQNPNVQNSFVTKQ